MTIEATPDERATEPRPTAPPRCRCGVKTEWMWLEDQDDDGEIVDRYWWPKACWRCHEIDLMKMQLTMGALGMSGGRLSECQAERFVELVVSSAGMAHTAHTARFRWPFPWTRPWQWPAWLVWRLKRWASRDRFLVPTFSFGGDSDEEARR